MSAAASAQTGNRPGPGDGPAAPPPAPPAPEEGERQVAFSAGQLTYDSNSALVTASGDVRMNSEGNNLRADRVVWNRKSDEVRAEGSVRLVTPEGNIVYGDSVVLTDDMKNGV